MRTLSCIPHAEVTSGHLANGELLRILLCRAVLCQNGYYWILLSIICNQMYCVPDFQSKSEKREECSKIALFLLILFSSSDQVQVGPQVTVDKEIWNQIPMMDFMSADPQVLPINTAAATYPYYSGPSTQAYHQPRPVQQQQQQQQQQHHQQQQQQQQWSASYQHQGAQTGGSIGNVTQGYRPKRAPSASAHAMSHGTRAPAAHQQRQDYNGGVFSGVLPTLSRLPYTPQNPRRSRSRNSSACPRPDNAGRASRNSFANPNQPAGEGVNGGSRRTSAIHMQQRPSSRLKVPTGDEVKSSSEDGDMEEDGEKFRLELLTNYGLSDVKIGTILRIQYLCLVRGDMKLVDYFGVYVGNCLVVHCASLDDPAVEHLKLHREKFLNFTQEKAAAAACASAVSSLRVPRCYTTMTKLSELAEGCFRVIKYTTEQVQRVCPPASLFSQRRASRRATQLIGYCGYGDANLMYTNCEDFPSLPDATRSLVIHSKEIRLRFSLTSLAFAMWCCYGSEYVLPYDVLFNQQDEDCDPEVCIEKQEHFDKSRIVQRYLRAQDLLVKDDPPLVYAGGCLYNSQVQRGSMACPTSTSGGKTLNGQPASVKVLTSSTPLNLDAPEFKPKQLSVDTQVM